MDSIGLRVILAVMACGMGALGQSGITKQDIDRQQQQLNRDRWQYVRDTLAFQKAAQEGLDHAKDALIDYVSKKVVDGVFDAKQLPNPTEDVADLLKDGEVRQAFTEALHGDFKPWFKAISKWGAKKLLDTASDEFPWADPALLDSLITAANVVSMRVDAKQLDRRAADLLQRQTTITQTRKKLVTGPDGTDTYKPPPPPRPPSVPLKDYSALDQAVTQLDRWLALGDRAFDKTGGHDQDAEDQFYTAFPELAMCANCRRTAITGSPATEVTETFKNGPMEIRFDPSSMSPEERAGWLRTQQKMARETLSPPPPRRVEGAFRRGEDCSDLEVFGCLGGVYQEM